MWWQIIIFLVKEPTLGLVINVSKKPPTEKRTALSGVFCVFFMSGCVIYCHSYIHGPDSNTAQQIHAAGLVSGNAHPELS